MRRTGAASRVWIGLLVLLSGGPAVRCGEAEREFTVVVLPDTQYYAKDYPRTLQAQVDWIVANRARLNIVYVAHVGDVVDRSRAREQWQNAANALYRLEDPALTGLAEGIPLGMVPGNHDHAGPGEAKLFNEYFGVAHFAKRSWYGGHLGGNNNNHFDLLSAGGLDLVVVYLDYRTNDRKTNAESAVDYAVSAVSDFLAKQTQTAEPVDLSAEDAWVDSVLKQHANRRAILVTHSAVNASGEFTARGREIYGRLQDNPNLFLILCGHVAGEARREDVFEGHVIHSCLADYQKEANGGDGWLRLYRFSPERKQIRVATYSPTLDQWRTGPESQFTLTGLRFAVSERLSASASGSR